MILMTRKFDRWAKKTGLTQQLLLDAVAEMNRGLIDADLGGGLVKKRIALPGSGKRGSTRTLIATNRKDRWIFLYGYAKNERQDIKTREAATLRVLAGDLLVQNMEHIAAAIRAGDLIEVTMEKRSPILEAVHETASDLYRSGLIDKKAMGRYDILCLPPVPKYTPEQIKLIRERYEITQYELSLLLNTTLATIEKWEAGQKRPDRPSQKLLNILDTKGLEVMT